MAGFESRHLTDLVRTPHERLKCSGVNGIAHAVFDGTTKRADLRNRPSMHSRAKNVQQIRLAPRFWNNRASPKPEGRSLKRGIMLKTAAMREETLCISESEARRMNPGGSDIRNNQTRLQRLARSRCRHCLLSSGKARSLSWPTVEAPRLRDLRCRSRSRNR